MHTETLTARGKKARGENLVNRSAGRRVVALLGLSFSARLREIDRVERRTETLVLLHDPMLTLLSLFIIYVATESKLFIITFC